MGQALLANQNELFKELIRRGSDINSLVVEGDIPHSVLHEACAKGNFPLIRLIFEQSPDVNVRDKNGQTPLHYAVKPEITHFLLSKGADTSSHDCDGVTPLHLAAMSGNDLLVQQLLDPQASSNNKAIEIEHAEDLALQSLNEQGDHLSPRLKNQLMGYALKSNRKELFKKWISLGADINSLSVKSNGCKQSVLHEVCSMGRLDWVKQLLEVDGINIALLDENGRTPLYYAARSGNIAIVDLLLAKTNPDERNSDGSSALHIAAMRGDDPMVERLIEAGAQVDTYFSDQMIRPIDLAAFQGNVSTVKLLLNKHSNPDVFRFPRVISVLSYAHFGLEHSHRSREKFNEIEKALIEAGGRNLEIAENSYSKTTSQFEQIISNMNGVKNSQNIEYEGMSVWDRIGESVANSLEQMPWEWDSFSAEELREACLKSKQPADYEARSAYRLEIPERIKKGELTILATGWPRHCVYLVFYKGYMAICNRGDRPGLLWAAPTNLVFKIDRNKVHSASRKIEQILDPRLSKTFLSKEFFYKELPEILGGQKDELSKQLESVHQNVDQKVGNCSFNIKGALRMSAAFLAVLGKNRPAERGIEEAYEFSKKWSTFFRMISLNSYLNDQQRAHRHNKLDYYTLQLGGRDPYSLDDYLVREVEKKIAKRQQNPIARIMPTRARLRL